MKMKKLWVLLFCISLCLLCACGNTIDLHDVETVPFTSDFGFSLTVPADWQLTESLEDYTVYQFVAPNQDLSLLVLSELDGMWYDSPEEVGDKLTAELAEDLFTEYTTVSTNSGKQWYTQVVSGVDEAGNQLTGSINLAAPYTSIRYYLVYVADSATYAEYKPLIEQVTASFTVNKTAEELYQLRDKIEEESLQALIEEQLQSMETEEEAEGSEESAE